MLVRLVPSLLLAAEAAGGVQRVALGFTAHDLALVSEEGEVEVGEGRWTLEVGQAAVAVDLV